MSEKPTVERREEPDLDKIWNLLLEVNQKLTDHIADEKSWKPDLLKVLDLFRESKGAITLIKISAVVSASLAGAYVFFSSHFTWKG